MNRTRFRSRRGVRRFFDDSALVELLERRLVLTPGLMLSFSQQSIWEAAFGTATGFVTRTDSDNLQSVVVSLSVDDPTELSVPATVTIAAGQTSATFTARGVDDSLLDGTQHVTVTATATLRGLNGGPFGATAQRTIDVVDYESILTNSISIRQMTSYGQTGFVRIERSNTDIAAPVTVTIENADPSELITPATVTFAAGAKSVDVPVQFLDNNTPDGTRVVNLVFRAAGYQNGGNQITLVEPGTKSLVVAVDGSAFNSDADPDFESVDTTSASIKIQPKYRGLFEFDTSAYAGRQIDAVALTLDPWTSGYFAGDVFNFDVYAYAADGVISVADAVRTTAKVGGFSVDTSSWFGATKRETIVLDVATIRSFLEFAGPKIGFVVVYTAGGSQYEVNSLEQTFSGQEPAQLHFFLQNNAPVMASDYTFSVTENSPAATAVGSVAATDPNAGDAITYSIVSGNGFGAFSINSLTGAIRVSSPSLLDFEATPQWVLRVRATDDGRGSLFSESTVTINVGDIVAPQVVKVEVGYGNNQWADVSLLAGRTAPWQITKLRITFSQAVAVDVNDLKIVNAAAATLGFSAFAYDAASFAAVWTLASPLEADELTITLDGDATNVENQNTDRNFGVSTNGEYLAGGDYQISLDVLYGDVNGDRTVNLIDALMQRGRNGTDDVWGDVNGDGTVNLVDALLLRGRNGTTLP